MNVYQKLSVARGRFHQMELKKSGHNKFAGYYYFELSDFVVPALQVMKEVGLTPIISFGKELAEMRLVNDDKPEEIIVITSPMSEAALKGCHPVQNLGAVESYIRRYLWVAALEIVEHDALDATTGRKGDAPIITPKSGIGDDLPPEDKEFLQETAQSVEDLCKAGKASDALAMVDEMALESDQKVYLFGFLSAPTRAALKKAKPV
jgi:hypothetical protein